MRALEWVLLATSLASAAGFIWAWLGWQKAKLSLSLAEERLALMKDAQEAAAESLRAQALRSAEAVTQTLVARATESFEAQDRVARARMDAQLKPVAETLVRFQEQVAALEKARATETGGLKEQLRLLMEASTATRDEARRLTEALKGNTGRRGRWGEETCRNVLAAAGMAEHYDFEAQVSLETDEGHRLRPDFVVKLPGGGVFVIDAKVSLAFEGEEDVDDETQQLMRSARIAESMRRHVRDLSSKAYQSQLEKSPDFVAMFVPGDAFLASALDAQPELMTDAMDARVVIVTPTTLFALCKAVAYGWRVEEQAQNAQEVVRTGKELYARLSTMGTHVLSLGKALDRTVEHYNRFVGSLESRVLVQARRFEDLKVDTQGKEIPPPVALERSVQGLSAPELQLPGETGPAKVSGG
ncbi:MAG TPA: DNA recombination protein RmuC [Myxococcaceae bacterium]|nr:DNA recombination protein RmuC [Myxococcaceae bacterium]